MAFSWYWDDGSDCNYYWMTSHDDDKSVLLLLPDVGDLWGDNLGAEYLWFGEVF